MRASRKAFTLAEVLVTIGIIGVVAALTIPSLIYGVIDQRYRSFLKKDLSALNQAIYSSIAEKDYDTSSTNITTNASLAAFFKPYFNVIGTSADGSTLWLSDGSKMGFVSVGPDTSKCVAIPTPSVLGALASSCYVIVDVNGDKGPNKVSTVAATSDVFILGIGPKSVVPVGEANTLTVTTIPDGFANDVSGNAIVTNPYVDAIPGDASIDAVITGAT